MQRVLSLLVTVAFFTVTTLPAQAVTLLRDPDIEHALKQLAKPVLTAAGLSPSRVKILIIDDRTLNAFVIDSRHIFLHSGLVTKVKTAAELQAVIAHEAAHIANGHIARRMVNARSAKTVAGIGMALAAAAIAGGADSSAAGALGIGIASSASRAFMGHTRAEESSADQSALRFMVRGGVDPQGAVRLMQIFSGQELVSAARQDPYARTHPLSRDRLRHIKAIAEAYEGRTKANPNMDYWFSRAQGKLSAFQRAPKWTRKRAAESAGQDIRLMRLAVSYHRDSNTAKALKTMQQLLSLRPRDPFYHELHGQILLESRNVGRALKAYKTAISLAPKDALILGSYGHALLVSGNAKAALPMLEKSRARDGRDARVLRDLAQSYAKLKNPGMASLVTAERYALQGRMKDAGIHAKRAAGILPRGSTGWQRAQDVLLASEAAQKK
ncbi:M48 family metalloprotease [Alisedimentitalea sp. MJ-SS2]|uniref:M48 family metalloprotease n=1 Tax=Aliisedimentitalea sp. MJ-SS2 TaxID=3049795 RepID=UPI00290D0454|nr:M48 family metalloprotease [Alisedimentitalea sp. MJ-SS2]MDU8926447.1 M48 family metalloprotease [Alisedimentitalea sp. MJ-SS2]